MSVTTLSPLLAAGQPVDWWLAFKFNAATYSGIEAQEPNPGLFGGTPVEYGGGFSLSYALASSANSALQLATGYLGTAVTDPLGATFNQIYQGDCNYVVWNDQFYGSPMPSQDAPWGHSKGVLAWDSTGAGLVLQVTSPSWPASGSARSPRAGDGNTLGCVHDDDVMVSQHFFALKLSAADMAVVLAGLTDASVVTRALPTPNSPTIPQVFNVTGPASLAALAQKLGVLSSFSTVTKTVLSSGVTFIVKPSLLHVPPWQMVSAQLGGLPIRAATWWTDPAIPSTTAATPVGCWDAALGAPGAVQIATTGTWQGKSIGLEGGEGTTFNHAKIGVSMDSTRPLCIFGDMNQQGTLSGADGTCGSSQNGRGGTFYVLENEALWNSLTALLNGESAPLAPAAAAAAPAAILSPAEKAKGPRGPVRGPADR
jgi:Deoxyribonuclease II